MKKTAFASFRVLALVGGLGAAVVGCGEDDLLGDGDGGVTRGDGGADASGTPVCTSGPNGRCWALNTDMYTIKSVNPGFMDGCMDGVDKSPPIGNKLPVNVTVMNNVGMVSVGNPVMNATPMQASLGSGTIGNNMATLMGDVMVTAGNCRFRRQVTSMLTLTGDYMFDLAVRRQESEHTSGCIDLKPCTSTWTWKFAK